MLRQLKDKTHEVESLSLKIDELQQAQYAAQTRVEQVKRFNQELYTRTLEKLTTGTMSFQDLRKEISDMNKQLEAFPRQNKNCVEYYEKYSLKYEELQTKFTSQQKTEEQISELLTSLKEKKAKSIEDNFKTLSRNFSAIFKSIVKDGSAQLKLVKMMQSESQKSE